MGEEDEEEEKEEGEEEEEERVVAAAAWTVLGGGNGCELWPRDERAQRGMEGRGGYCVRRMDVGAPWVSQILAR